MERLDVMLELIADQAPALFVVDGVGYEGHVESCVGGTVVAVARPAGGGERTRYQWQFAQITDFGPADERPAAEEDEDPMMQQARELAARAHEYSELSLAERLLRGRATQGSREDGNHSTTRRG